MNKICTAVLHVYCLLSSGLLFVFLFSFTFQLTIITQSKLLIPDQTFESSIRCKLNARHLDQAQVVLSHMVLMF